MTPRSDPETIIRRLGEYAEKTVPLTDFYAAQGKLVRINAAGTPEAVTAATIAAAEPY